MAYSNEELTQRVKQLENIVLDLMMQRPSGPGAYIRNICVNAALHSGSWRRPEDEQEHPSGLQLPHYVWQPMIAWGRDQIHLHPNQTRA